MDTAGEPNDPLSERDDVVAAFQIDQRPVRGRFARLGPVMDDILSAHSYRAPVGRLLGEALVLAVLVGASLKMNGRLIVQARGRGPVSLLVADYHTDGQVRGFAKVHNEALDAVLAAEPRPSVSMLLGAGELAMTIDQGPDMNQYQSLVPLEGRSLSEAAEGYFETSEQVPTRVRLAVGQLQVGDGRPTWRAGGAIMQRIAGDAARGDTADAWETARTLFDTVTDEELIAPDLSAGRVLFRLFHEEGVRLEPGASVIKRCPCSAQHIARVLAAFPESEIADLAEDDGRLKVTCEYCNRDFFVTQDAVKDAGAG